MRVIIQSVCRYQTKRGRNDFGPRVEYPKILCEIRLEIASMDSLFTTKVVEQPLCKVPRKERGRRTGKGS